MIPHQGLCGLVAQDMKDIERNIISAGGDQQLIAIQYKVPYFRLLTIANRYTSILFHIHCPFAIMKIIL